MRIIENNKWYGIFGKKSLFYKTLVLLLALSITSILFFGVFMNVVYSSSQREKITELNLLQLTRTSEELDMTFEVMSKSMSQSLYSSDFIKIMIDPAYYNADTETRAVNMLKDQVATHELVDSAFFYSPFSERLYSSDGTVLPIEDAEEQKVVEHYLEVLPPPDIYTEITRSWEVMYYEDYVYLITEMTTPVFVGAMFWQLNPESLREIVLTGNDNPDYIIDVYDSEGNGILISGEELQASDWEDQELFVRDMNDTQGEYYLVESLEIGWKYVCRVGQVLVPVGMTSLAAIFIPALLIYAIISIAASMYITQNVYRPIQHLMKLTLETSQPQEERQNEVDYLELAWTRSQKEREHQAQVMQSVSADVMRQLIHETLDGRVAEEEKIKDTLEKIGMPEWVCGRFVVIAVSIIPPEDRSPNLVEDALYRRSLVQLMQDRETDRFRIYTLVMESRTLATVICCGEDVTGAEIKQFKTELLKNLELHVKKLPFQLVIGKGRIYRRFVDISYSYQEAVDDIRYQKYFADGIEESDEEIEPAKERHDRHYVRERVRQILEVAAEGRRSDAETQMEAVIREIAGRYLDFEQAKSFLETAADEAVEFLIMKGIAPEDLAQIRVKLDLEDIAELDDRDLAEQRVKDFCKEGIRLISSNSKKSRYRYVDEAKAYVAEHYTDSNLSLNEISEYIGITSSYLSGLFVEVTQEYFSAYLNSYRIEQAKQLLATTGQTITVIGYKCGFNSVQSFCRVFKKVAGITPNQYREQQKGVKDEG